jgi:hypothetical protein
VVAGNAANLARAERRVGLESWSVSLESHEFGYEPDELAVRNGGTLAREVARWRLLARALRDFDIVHFNFGSSLMPQRLPAVGDAHYSGLTGRAYGVYASLLELRDLPVLKRAGKGIVVTYQGDDARQGDASQRLAMEHLTEIEPDYYTPWSDAAKRRRIGRFDRYADRIFGLVPDLLRVLPARAEFLPYANVDLGELRPKPLPAREPMVVVHAPSSRRIKGTRHVVAAIERLRSEGVPVELRLVEGMRQTDARKLYEQADLAVDQLLLGFYAGFAVEMMALGRPVIAYVREEDLAFVPDEMRTELPVINAKPETIYDVLKRCLTTDRDGLAELGTRSRAFVERWHDPLRIAARLKRDYEEIAPRRRSD